MRLEAEAALAVLRIVQDRDWVLVSSDIVDLELSNMSEAIEYMNPVIVRREGIKALSDALTPVGMAHFFRQIESGEGNYTDEKDELTKHYTTESIMEGLMKLRNLDSKVK